MKNQICKKLVAWLLLFCIMLTNVPTVAFAVDDGTTPPKESSEPSPTVTVSPTPEPSTQPSTEPSTEPSSAPDPVEPSGTSQDQKDENAGGEPSPVPSQVPEKQERANVIADVTELVSITVRLPVVQDVNIPPALTLDNFVFYDQDGNPIVFSGSVSCNGSSSDGSGTNYSYSVKGVPDQGGREMKLRVVDTPGYEFSVVGADADGLLLMKKNNGVFYSLADGRSITISIVEIPPEPVGPTVIFDIEWHDMLNAAGLRPDIKDIIAVYISEDDVLEDSEMLDSRTLLFEDLVSKISDDVETVSYKLNAPVVEGMTRVPAEYIKIAFLRDQIPVAYTGIVSNSAYSGIPSTRLEDVETVEFGLVAKATEPVIIALEQYEVAVKPEGLSEEALANFSITATLGEEEYTDFVKSAADPFVYNGFAKLDADGNPAAYTVTWPAEVDDYVLISAEGSGIVNIENPALNAAPKYAKKFENSGDDVSSSRNVIWFDTDASYSHSGQLSVQIPVTVGDKTITVAPAWDSESGRYVHKWTAQNMKDLSIELDDEDMAYFLEEMEDLIITDTGENNLNRTLTATTTKSVTVPDGERRKEGYVFQLGTIDVTDVSYSPESDSAVIQDYAIGTDPTNHNTLTLYPMTYVDFKFDVRAGDYTALYALEYLSGINAIQLLLQDSITAGWQDAPIAEGYFKNYFGIEEIDWESVSIDDKHASYRILMPLYDVNKRQIAYAFDSVSGKTISLYPDIWLRVEYDNTAVPGMGTHTDRTYEDGTMVFILTGITDFTATKIWADDGSPDTVAKRPKATYTLWRYSEKSGDYTTAAMQMIPQGSTLVDEADISTTESPFQIVLPNTLERFDSDGYPYVYFIRENLSGGTNYEKIYGVVGEGPDGKENVTDTLPYDGKRKGSDRSIYDTGTITNRRSEPITANVTKEWKAAYYQDSFDELSVEMTLYAKHKNAQGENDEAFVVDTILIEDFDEFNSTRSGSVNINRFDDHGHELVFWWEETAVIQDGQRIEVGATADNNNVKYTLPLNEATMKADSYSETSEEYFVASIQQNANGNAHVINKLEGDTEYWLLKEWHDMPAGNASFQLVKIDENGVMTEVNPGGEYTIYSTNPGYATPDEEGNYSSGWIKAWVDLEKYDDNGNRYGYIAKEGGGNYESLESYGNNVDDDPEEEANSLKVVNSPVGIVRDIDLRKVWLDDTANTARDSVYFNVYTAAGQIIYGTDGANVGLLDPNPVEITATNEWTMPGVDMTLWVVDGVLSTELVIPEEVQAQGNEAVLEYKRQHLYNGDFYVTEVRVGENNYVSNVELTEAGYPTVSSKGTDFVVIYNTDNADHTKGTNLLDEENFYTVTNLRIGVTDLTVTKKWYDDEEVNRDCYTATFTVSCDEDEERVVEIDGLGYAQVHEAVSPDKLQNITNAAGANVSSVQTIDTASDVVQITYYNLPLYDEYGKILHYSVEEDLQGEDPDHEGRYEISSSEMSRNPVENNNSQVIAAQTFTNTFKNTTSISFDLLWLDDYRINNAQRPDVFLYLYKTQNTYDENGNITGTQIVRNDFVEYLWKGTNNEKKTEDWWRYTFSGLDEYDQYGNKIYYYATIQTHANREILDYIAPQYAEGQAVSNYEAYLAQTHSSVGKTGGEYVVNHNPASDIIGYYPGTDTKTNDVLLQENTFVIQLKSDVNVVGHKVWEKIPDGFPIPDLPLLSFKLYRSQTAYEIENNIQPSDENGFCTAAIVRYQSPSQEYNFEMNWYGINDNEGNLVAANTVIYDMDGNKTDTALNIWVEMTGLDASLYGQPLPKYDGLGEMYKYSIIEIVADSKGSIDIAYEDLESAVNGYTIINTYNTTITNYRPISVSKNWLYNGKPISEAAEGFVYLYPSAVTYNLYRFYKIDFASGYSVPELMGTITLTREEAEAGISQVFEKQLVYAPNGNKYIYYVSEDLIKGYNTNEDNSYPLMLISKEAELYTRDINLSNWPTVIGGKDSKAWYSPAFVLDEKASSSDDNTAGDVGVSNSYTGLPQTDYEGVKIWEDYSNQFGTRPNSLTLTLYRKTKTIANEAVATIVLKNGQPAEVTLTENPNVTSEILNNEITVTNVVSGNNWSFKIDKLDGYAPTGEEWVYSVVETLPDHYKKSVDGNKITNNFYTSYTGTKRWVELNDDIAYPEVEVKLQVSTDGVAWDDAASVFGTKLGNYTYTATLKEANDWKATFSKLPIGTGLGEDYKAYKYRLLETKIGGADVNYNGTDKTAAPVGVTVDGRYTVNVSESAIENGATKTKLSVTKLWEDDSDNAYGTRYSEDGKWSVSYHIKRDYTSRASGATVTDTLMVPDGSTEYVLTVTGTDDQTEVTAEITDLPSYTPFGEKYTYYAVELDVDGEEIEDGGRFNGAYETTYENSDSVNGDSTVATNRLILVELEVTKLWTGEGDKTVRPDDIELSLKQNGETIEYPGEIEWTKNADGEDVWFIVYSMLPKYDASGAEYEYTVSEVKQGGYRVPVIVDGEPQLDEHNQAQVIDNIQTYFSIDKVDENGKSINDVTLVFVSEAKISNPKLGGSHYYQLTWSRDINGNASYEIRYNSSNNDFPEAQVWASGEGSVIYGLPEGTYKLTEETTIPAGYYASSVGGTFTLRTSTSKDGVQRLEVTGDLKGAGEPNAEYPEISSTMAYLQVPNKPTVLSIVKKDKNTGGNISKDWIFTIQPVAGSAFASHTAGEDVTSARPFNAGDKWTGVLIVDNVYKLNETVAPPGYKRFTGDVYFTVDKTNTIKICNADGTPSTSTDPAAGGANGVLTFKDEPFSFVVKKYTSTDDTLITKYNTTFILYDITNGQNVAVKLDGKNNIVTSNGTRTISSTKTDPKLTVGHTYKLVEYVAPNGYIMPTTAPSIEFTFGDDGSIISHSNEVGDVERNGNTISYTDDPIKLVLTKKDSGDRIQKETILKNVSFTLFDITDNKTVGTATTNDSGEITFGGESMLLVIGGHSYKLTETKPNGYTAVDPIYFSVTKDGKIVIDGTNNPLPDRVSNPDESNLVAVNTRKLGTLSIIKKDGLTGSTLDNISFSLYRENDDDNWFDRFIAIITGNKYILLDNFDWEKSDGDLDIVNVGNGTIRVENLDWGRYKLVETAAEGYILEDEKEYFFTVGANSTDNEIIIDDDKLISGGVINNTPIRVQVNKVDKDNHSTTLAGAVYELYYVIDKKGAQINRPIPNNDDKLADWEWNSETGIGTASYLSPGTYKLVETVPPPGYTKADDITFTVDKYGIVKINGEQIDAEDSISLIFAEDTDFDISIEKLSDKDNKLAGAKFEIYDITNGGEEPVVLASGEEILSRASGALVIGSTETVPALQVGHRYAVREVEAPRGYILPDVRPEVQFNITDDGTFSNISTYGGASVNGTTISASDEPISLTLVKYDNGDHVVKKDELGGVEFTLFDVTANKEVGTVVTKDETGLITFGAEGDLLVIGGHEYTLTETEQAGYETLGVLRFKVSFDGEIEIIDKPDGYTQPGSTALEAVNNRILGTLTLLKKDSVTNEALNKVKFELYRAEELNEDGTPKSFLDRVIEMITGKKYSLEASFTWDGEGMNGIDVKTAADGTLIVEKLDWGSYKLVETVSDGYILPEGIKERSYLFVIDENNSEAVLTLEADGETVLQDGLLLNTPNGLNVVKVDTEGNVLSGAIYELHYVSDVSGNATGRQIPNAVDVHATWVWNSESGTGEASRLTAGTYKLVEALPPAGYTKADDIYFTINVHGEVFVDGEQILGQDSLPLIEAVDTDFEISIEKLSDKDNKLADAKFEIYDITNGGEEPVVLASGAEIRSLDSGALVIGSTETVPALQVGHRYAVREVEAPRGYILPDVHPEIRFTISDKGVLTDVSSTADADNDGNAMSFTDEPIELSLVKFDGGDRNFTKDELGGVEFTLFDVTANEEVGTVITKDETGLITFGAEGDLLVIGGHEYTLTETAQAGYETLGVLRFNVSFDGEIEIIDKPDGYTQPGSTALEAVNKRILGTLTILKMDSVSEEAVNNVKFELYRAKILDENGEPLTWFERLVALITGNGYVLTDEFSWTGSGSTGIRDYVTDDGQIIVEDLDWGAYKLVETVADGYILPDDAEERTYTFVIDENNSHATVKFGDEVLEDNTIFNQPNRVIVQKVDAEDNTLILPGAEYELYYVKNKAGNEIERQIPNDTDAIATWVWDSETGIGEATHLTAGTYKLVETKSPYGYIIEEPVFFEIDTKGVVTVDGEVVESINSTPVVKAADTKTEFRFTKHELYNESCADGYSLDPDATRILDGVTFTAYEDEELTKAIMSAVSVDGVVEFIGLPLGINYIKETSTVAGHVLDDTVYMVEITSEGDDKLLYADDGSEVDDNTVINDVYRGSFSFHKVSEFDNNTIIPGAVYGLYKTVMIDFGPVNIPYEVLVTEATADEYGYVEFKGLLMDVEYTVRELSVPAGCYVSANPIVFMLTWTESGAVTTIIDDGEGTIAESDSGNIWREPQTVIEFLKTNHKGVPLPGAVLQLRDKDGNIVMVPDFNGEMVESWVSTKTALVVTGILTAGETYWLYELEAPKGYGLAKPIQFEVPDEPVAPDQAFVVTITMKNYPFPVTADGNDLTGYIAAMGTSGLGLIFLALFGRRRKRKDEAGA